MKKTVWLSFDLALGSDYENLYAWLDDLDAQECGNGVAKINLDVEKDLPDELTKSLRERVNFSKKDRIYALWREDGKLKGRFLIGRRKFAPWKGYGAKAELEDTEV
jgi:hypothetical protein